MNSGLGTSVRLSAACALIAALAGCGGDSARPPVVVNTPQPMRSIWAQTSFTGFAPDIWVSIELILSDKGALDITTDWTFPDTWMFVYLGNTPCTYAQLSSRACPFLISSETKNPKPRVLFTETLQPGTYYLVLYNVPAVPKTDVGSANTEAVAVQVGLTVIPGAAQAEGSVRVGHTRVVRPL